MCVMVKPAFLFFFSSEKSLVVLFVPGNFRDAVPICTVFPVGTGESFMNVQGICGLGQPVREAKFCVLLL